MSVHSGLDLIQGPYQRWVHGKVALLANASSVDRYLRSAVDILRTDLHVQLAALFSPEHGFAGAADQENIDSHVDPRTGIVVHSLYENWAAIKPTHDMLDGIDMVVCDLQDIGARFYTYAWSVTKVLEGAGEAGIPVTILDRPNPLGNVIDGQMLDMAYESAVGRAPIPIQHGLTLGELAKLFNTHWNPTPADLTVIWCAPYHRGMTWEKTGLPFVPTSPAMPHLSTARQYPGACLVEGTNLSEGRGTALPFEIVGAPFIEPDRLIVWLKAQSGLIGAGFRPHSFVPTSSKYVGEICHGLQVHRLNQHFRPLPVWVAVLSAIRQLYPDQFEWKPRGFDNLAGGALLRQQIEAGEPVTVIIDSWKESLAAFDTLRREVFIYA